MSFGPRRANRARALASSLFAALSLGLGCSRESAALRSSVKDPGLQAAKPAALARSLAQAPFEARRERPLTAKPAGLCAADFDGDGSDDLAMTFLVPGGSIVWRGSPTGLAREGALRRCDDYPLAPLCLPRGHFGAAAVERRLALASRASRVLEIVPAFPTASDPHLWTPLALDRVPRAMATGIVRGKALLAVACDERRLELFHEDAPKPEHCKLSGDYPRCALVCGELEAVLVGFQDSMQIQACVPEGASPIGPLQLSGIPRDMETIDVDGDGDKELVVAAGDRELLIFGRGASSGPRGWFEPGAPTVWDSGAIPLQLAVADFDADARADLAVLHHYDLSARLLCKLSTSGAGSDATSHVGQTPIGFAVLDTDGDGRLDLAVANRDTQGLGLLPGNGAGAVFAGTSVALGDFPNALAAAPEQDSKNGVLRLVALNSKSDSASAVVLEGGRLRALPGVPTGSQPRAPIIAELDGAPGLDVLLLGTNPRGARLVLLSGDLSGSLGPAKELELGGAASDLALIDVDGDGKPELAICDPTTSSVMLCESTATRCDALGLRGAARLRVPSAPLALSAIELDGDPASELACVLGGPGERVGVAWLDARRKSSGELELFELGFSALPGAPIDAASCDLNGDGRADLAVLVLDAPNSTAGKWFALLRGRGGPADFKLSAPIPTGLRPHRIAARDLDGDGRAEVFVTAQDSHLVNAWTPEASSSADSFVARAWDDLGAGRGPLDLCLTDADGDGRIDLCVVNGFSNDVSVLHGRAVAKPK